MYVTKTYLITHDLQPDQKNRKQTTIVRLLAVALLGGKIPQYRGFRLWRNALDAGLKVNAKAFAGTLLRKLKGRI